MGATVQAIIGGVFLLLSQWLAHRLQNKEKVQATAAVIGDVGVILLLAAAGSAIVAIATSGTDIDTDAYMAAIGFSNTVFATIGFAISGSRTTGSRWRHLFIVAVVTWLVSFINVLGGLTLNFGSSPYRVF